jgi:rod shape-determining protein MreC
MPQFLSFIRFFREYLVLVLLVSLSIVLIAHSDSASVRALRSVAIAAFASFQATPAYISGQFTGSRGEEQLQEINLRLLEEVMELRGMRRENGELRSLVSFKQQSAWRLIPAEVVGKNFAPGQQTITLNVGSSDSVAPRMPVITQKGLVGRVIATSPGYCVVQLAVNRDFRATARIIRSRTDGIIAYKDGEMLLLQNVWKTSDIIAGDTVVTSELSNTFPSGIPIGIVKRIGPDERGVFSKIDVIPNVYFSGLERVFVIPFIGSEERRALEQNEAVPR